MGREEGHGKRVQGREVGAGGEMMCRKNEEGKGMGVQGREWVCMRRGCKCKGKERRRKEGAGVLKGFIGRGAKATKGVQERKGVQ